MSRVVIQFNHLAEVPVDEIPCNTFFFGEIWSDTKDEVEYRGLFLKAIGDHLIQISYPNVVWTDPRCFYITNYQPVDVRIVCKKASE